MTRIKAMVITATGGEATLELAEVPRPGLRAGEVRVAVRAASVNRADLLVRAGTHPSSAAAAGPPIAGLDAAGEVVEVGAEVTGLGAGDRVMTIVGGGLAQEIVVRADMVVKVPEAWSYVEGAAAILGLLTEHDALVTAGRMVRGDTVLVHAVASGAGTQAVQLARHLGAGTIAGTTRGPRDAGRLKALGLDELIVTSETDFADRLREIGDGADVIVDHVGGPYLAGNVRAAALRGRIVDVGRLGGAEGTLDLEEVARKRLTVVGTTFRTRTVEEKVAVVAALRDGVDLEDAAEVLRPLVDRTFPWTAALEAQRELSRNRHVGKLVLEVE